MTPDDLPPGAAETDGVHHPSINQPSVRTSTSQSSDADSTEVTKESRTYAIRGELNHEIEDLSSEMEISNPPVDYILRDQAEAGLTKPPAGRDYRLYLPKHSGWVAVIKESWEQEHCYARNPGEEWFHLLANGEIYVQRGAEKYCLTCALRHKILTRNRLFWEKGAREPLDE